MKTVLVRFYWLTPAEGGCANIPSCRVSAPVRFEGESEAQWSILATYVSPVEHRTCEAHVRFLVEAAPHEKLRPGVRFDLMAGRHVVSQGEVLSEINAFETPDE